MADRPNTREALACLLGELAGAPIARTAGFQILEALEEHGIVIMPAEPTEDMMAAAYKPDYFGFARQTYAAMRAKSPFEDKGE